MLVREWVKAEGLNVQTVWRWCRENTMPVPYEKTPTGTYLIHDPKYGEALPQIEGKVVCYARVSSSGQKENLDRLYAFAISTGIDDPKMVKEVGSGMNENPSKLNKIFSDLAITTLIAEHRDRLARVNVNLIESVLNASGRRLVVVNTSECVCMDDVEQSKELSGRCWR